MTRLMDTAANADAAPQVRAAATQTLRTLNELLKSPAWLTQPN